MLFCGLSLLPSMIHLTWKSVPVINPYVAIGPITAGFVFAAGLCRTRMSFAVLGVLVTALIWMTNWLMAAGSDCCSMN